jgi:hypothetical protein
MPCRCCGVSRPSKGFTEPGEAQINEMLKTAATLILIKAKESIGYDDIEEWKKGWQEAFDHHLNGCNEQRCGCGSVKAREGEVFTHYCCDCKQKLI